MGCTTSTIERQSADARRAHKERGIANDYELKTEIGKGSFATVRVCVHKKTQSERAVKVLMTHNEKQKTKAARELDVWKKVGQHENIVVLMDSYISCGVYYFVMQRCNRIISNAFPLCGDTSSYVDFLGGFHQVFLGLHHLQSINVVHRDIKAPNLLVDSDDTVKIGDFGLAIPKEEGGLIGMKGSIPFMSPQMVTGERYGFDTDIWACGALIYSLVFGTYVYDVSSPDTTTLDERKKLMRKAIATDTPKPAYQPVEGIAPPSSHVCDFLKLLLQRNVQNRPSAHSCVKMILEVKAALKSNGVDESDQHWRKELSAEKQERTFKMTESWDTGCPSDTNTSISNQFSNIGSQTTIS